MTHELDGLVAVVTGAGSGIGRGIAHRVAADGATVIAADINVAGAESTISSLREGKNGSRAAYCDITDGASVRRLHDEILADFGRCDILINNAGWEMVKPFTETDPVLWQRLIGINLLGMITMTHTFVQGMIKAGRGAIVNMGSDAGRVGSSGETVYASAKGGIIAFTKSLAREVARYSIPVNCVCPGPTNTPAFDIVPPKLQQALIKAIPFRRIAQPEDVANAVSFFASPRSSYITGQVLSVNGGLTMVG